jgi:uncharacterized protein (TIGR02391 family)
MRELIEDRINKLSDVGQIAFNGSDYTFGFETWRSGTITLLRQVVPKKTDIVEQIQNINLHRVDHNRTDSKAYNLEACKNEAKEILKILLSTLPANTAQLNDDSFWSLLHPKVLELAKPRFDNGFYGDAIVSCLREANSIIKVHVRAQIGQELDGAALMTRAFSVNNPIISLADLTTETGRNIQQGYMQMFAGQMIGVRNPKSHENMNPDRVKTIHLLFHASFLFIKLDEAGVQGP